MAQTIPSEHGGTKKKERIIKKRERCAHEYFSIVAGFFFCSSHLFIIWSGILVSCESEREQKKHAECVRERERVREEECCLHWRTGEMAGWLIAWLEYTSHRRPETECCEY